MGTITIVGLGPGAVGHLSLETMGLLQNCAQVILRTAVHRLLWQQSLPCWLPG